MAEPEEPPPETPPDRPIPLGPRPSRLWILVAMIAIVSLLAGMVAMSVDPLGRDPAAPATTPVDEDQ